MADVRIQDLTPANSVQRTDRFVLEQSGQAKSLTGQILINDLAVALDGHGGISSIAYYPPVSPSLSGMLIITMTDETQYNLPVTNGRGIAGITWSTSGTSGDGQYHNGTIEYNDGTTSAVQIRDGLKGDIGPRTYVWFKWAQNYPTSDSDMQNSVGPYIGIYAGLATSAPTTYQSYIWYQYKGDTGDTGASIASITKTGTVGLVDTYTVELTNGNTSTFTVTNAKSIVGIYLYSGTHAAGTEDVYKINYNDGTETEFKVYNGTNGGGSVSSVSGIQAVGTDVPQVISGSGAPTASTVGQQNQLYFDTQNSTMYYCGGQNQGSYLWYGAGVTVDSALSTLSENPVQNRVITGKIGTGSLSTTATNLIDAVNEVRGDIPVAGSTVPNSDVSNGSVGTAATWAKSDHRHKLNVATSGAPVKDGTASLGTATTYAKTDHVHPLNVDATAPADLGTASVGSATTYARRDHVHNTPIVVGSVTTTISWTDSGSGYYTQIVSVTGATSNSKVDLQPDATALLQLISDGVSALYIANNSGTLTMYAVGAAPTAVLTMQVTITEVRV